MKIQLAPPSFWPEPRDPGAWQRVLRILAADEPINDPRPCWENRLEGTISRRSVPGVYGLRLKPAPALLVGCGLLTHTETGWRLHESARELLDLKAEAFQRAIAVWLVRRSPWVRLAILKLRDGAWRLPRGTSRLPANRSMRVGVDMVFDENDLEHLPDPRVLLGDQWCDDIHEIETAAKPKSLSALASPLYLLHAMNWLSNDGSPCLPSDLATDLGASSPASALKQITEQHADAAGFVAVELAMRELWRQLHGDVASYDPARWQDLVVDNAIRSGAIEVHDWAPGQPRHGRGFLGDRDRKLVRWTVHNNFTVPDQDAPESNSKSATKQELRKPANSNGGRSHFAQHEVKS
jgi:hypothetical protein